MGEISAAGLYETLVEIDRQIERVECGLRGLLGQGAAASAGLEALQGKRGASGAQFQRSRRRRAYATELHRV